MFSEHRLKLNLENTILNEDKGKNCERKIICRHNTKLRSKESIQNFVSPKIIPRKGTKAMGTKCIIRSQFNKRKKVKGEHERVLEESKKEGVHIRREVEARLQEDAGPL